jgi:molybdenum cofactor cytidylyltransferase
VIGAVILAAGGSTRMGRDKAMLLAGPDGATFVDAIQKTLRAAGVGVIRVVVAPGRERADRHDVVNPDPAAGMLSSIHCGLRSLPGELEGVIVWPVDHPLVSTSTVVRLIDAFRGSGAPVVVPSYRGRRGHPVLFAPRVLPELMAADPSFGARSIVHAHADRVELAIDDAGVVSDIDTPADYERHVTGRAS